MSKKEVILRAAMWLFSEKGFKDTSMAVQDDGRC
jgi:hypothetical protein